MDIIEVIDRLAATSSRSDKEQVLFEAFMTGQHAFFRGAKLAYQAQVTFGVASVPRIAENDLRPDDPGSLSEADFLALCEALRLRKLTGHAARDAIIDAASRCHGPTWNDFYRRVLLKDLDVGITEKSINKVLKKLAGADARAADLMIPVFGCQLAEDGNSPGHLAKRKGHKLVDVKLDGVRLLTILDIQARTVTQWTRDGHPNDGFPLIREGLEKLLPTLPASVVLDGEITGRNFQTLMTLLNRKTKVDTAEARLALFDVVPLADFFNGRCAMTQDQRHQVLAGMAGLLREHTDGRVWVIPKMAIDLDSEVGRAAFDQFNQEALAVGYEGVMVKDPLAPYECRRWTAWLKCKPVISVSLSVVGVEPGKADGKRRTVMGALVLRGEDEDKLIECKCGTGFSDQQLAEFWEQRDSLIGMVAEIEADCLTLKRGAATYSLRFPRWKGWRGTVPGEKL